MSIIYKQNMRAKWHHALKLLVHVRPYIKGLFSYVEGKRKKEKEKRIKEQSKLTNSWKE